MTAIGRVLIGVSMLAIASTGAAQDRAPRSGDGARPPSLEDGFRSPPHGSRPQVWWQWLNGNVTADGITRDLDWFAKIGIGGVQTFEIQLLTPKLVDRQLAHMTPEWRPVFRSAVEQAKRRGIDFTVHGAPGWSETGSPWVTPADAMKKVVWSSLDVAGSRTIDAALPDLPVATGPYQSMRRPGALGDGASASAAPTYGRDVRVLAYRLPPTAPLPAFRITSAGAPVADADHLRDGDMASTVTVARATSGEASLDLDYVAPATIRSARVFLPGAVPQFGSPTLVVRLEAKRDGVWMKVSDVPLRAVPTTIAFAPVSSSAFRLVAEPASGGDAIGNLDAKVPGAVTNILPPPSVPKNIRIGEFDLSGDARINAAEMKAGFATAADYYRLDADTLPDDRGAAPSAVVDLTARVKAGRLLWRAPAGQWRVLRLGYSLTGTENHPAMPQNTGLEVDKYDASSVRRYMERYLGEYAQVLGPDLMKAGGLRGLINDSTEVDPANWTPDMIAQFRRLRGYDPTPWLPALTGAIIGSRQRTDAFLYDFRRTLADLHASQHYGTIAQVAHERGLIVYGEALEDHRPVLGDDMAMRRYTDVPMSAFWSYNLETGPRATYLADVKGAASVANVYGQNLVGSEVLTSALAPWAYSPAELKPMIDRAFVTGVNKPVISASVHQPFDTGKPGLTMFIFGQQFNRYDAWAPLARPWMDYLARASFLLQQGRHVADLGYFYGEEAPLTALYGDAPVADAPTGRGWDFLNAAALGVLRVEDGELTAPGGARYRVLYLGGSSARMTLPTLRRLKALAAEGATIVGNAPADTPSLADDRAAFAALRREMWAGGAETLIGRGRVVAGRDAERTLITAGIVPDMTSGGAATEFTHRRTEDADIYFVVNRSGGPIATEARFRVTGRAAEFWNAVTGEREAVSYDVRNGTTVVPLALPPHGSTFVVFRRPASKAPTHAIIAPQHEQPVLTIEGPWTVEFQPDRGAPASVPMARLTPLSDSEAAGVRYFSGVATYRTSFDLPVRSGGIMMLDLGRVGDIAEVTLNGVVLGSAWTAPYRVSLGSAWKPGRNTLEVRVGNRWINRLIGDAQPGAVKITSTSLPTYKPEAPLRPSGLIGPVTVIARNARGS